MVGRFWPQTRPLEGLYFGFIWDLCWVDFVMLVIGVVILLVVVVVLVLVIVLVLVLVLVLVVVLVSKEYGVGCCCLMSCVC